LLREALNSNTLNMASGICVPATVSGVGALPGPTPFSAWWLLGITVINLFLLYRMNGFARMSGALSVGLCLVFASVVIGWRAI
jgi:hypothetical protein